MPTKVEHKKQEEQKERAAGQQQGLKWPTGNANTTAVTGSMKPNEKKQRKRGGERRGDEELEGKEAILATGAEARDQTNNWMTVGLAVHKAIFPFRSLRQRERAELRWLVHAFVVITAAVQHQLWLHLHLRKNMLLLTGTWLSICRQTLCLPSAGKVQPSRSVCSRFSLFFWQFEVFFALKLKIFKAFPRVECSSLANICLYAAWGCELIKLCLANFPTVCHTQHLLTAGAKLCCWLWPQQLCARSRNFCWQLNYAYDLCVVHLSWPCYKHIMFSYYWQVD